MHSWQPSSTYHPCGQAWWRAHTCYIDWTRVCEEHIGDWTNIAFGSIYFALGKLAEEGFIEQVAVEREGRRPSRSVYQITEAGQAEFLRLLREVWREVERHYCAMDVGLVFIDALPGEEIEGYLQGRIAQLESIVHHVAEHRAEQMAQPEVPALAAAVFDHGLAHFQAELDWTRDLLDMVEAGVYPCPPLARVPGARPGPTAGRGEPRRSGRTGDPGPGAGGAGADVGGSAAALHAGNDSHLAEPSGPRATLASWLRMGPSRSIQRKADSRQAHSGRMAYTLHSLGGGE
jgi:DNA-binding PadR family transcriptional regulator